MIYCLQTGHYEILPQNGDYGLLPTNR